MLWRIGILAGLFWFGMQVAFAEEPTVVQNPSGAYQTFKKVVDTLDPQVEQIYDFGGEWYSGASASLWTFTSNEIHLASLRAGYAVDADLANDHRAAYGGVKLDLPGLTQRYVPSTIKGIATAGPLSTLWSLAGRFSSVGFVAGRDFDQDETIVGVSLGSRITW